ncbi:hypothetical protein BKA83DRAFT_3367838 [Pisolithus microcarpus]|nr:hypothetical protein BKA83DRAFT_3367838 [Pisolithus microcarpus]
MHKKGCPSKSRQHSIHRVPLQAPSFTAHDLRTTATALGAIMSKIAIKHPLAPSQLGSLRIAGSVAGVPTPPSRGPSALQVDERANIRVVGYVLHRHPFWLAACALILHSRSPTHNVHVGVPFKIGCSVQGFFALMPLSLALSRASSISRLFMAGRERLHRCASPVRLRCANDMVPNSASAVGLLTSPTSAKDISLVHCPLCQRRIRLRSFATVMPAEEGLASEKQQQQSATCTFVLGERKICVSACVSSGDMGLPIPKTF